MTALRQIADKCAFDVITPDDLLRDRVIFGIVDNKVRKRLLREPELNLAKTLDICLSLKVLSGNFIRFEIDIGARCNVCLCIFTRRRPVILNSSMLRQPSLPLYATI